MSWGYQGGGGGSGGPRAQTAMVSTSAGVVRTLSRLLGSTSTFSLLAGTNANLTLTGGNQITAAVGIAAGASQVAVVREVNGQRAVEYPLTLTGAVLPPVNTVAPALSSSAAYVGQELTASNGTWSNSPSSYSYQWFWADTVTPISGATSASYTPVTGDLGHTLARNVTATNAGGSTTASSNVSAAVGEWAGPPAPTATFAMTQLGAANRVYQRATLTGGGQGKGAGTIPVTISAASGGTINARVRAADGVTVLQSEWAAATVAGAATTANIAGVDAREGWFYLDLKGGDGAWKLGTVLVGMGAVTFMSGQSLAVRSFGRMDSQTATNASLGVAISPNGSVYATYTDGQRSVTTPAWALPADGSNYDSTFAAEYLRQMVALTGVNCGLAGHSEGGAAISTFLSGGANYATLNTRMDETGGFEAFLWLNGHTDAGAGTTDATYQAGLTSLFANVATHNTARGSAFRKIVGTIPNIQSAQWGTAAQRRVIRNAARVWCAANSATFIDPRNLHLVDGVHQSQTGSIPLAQEYYRAQRPAFGAAHDHLGPVITSATRAIGSADVMLTVAMPAGATALTSIGTPGSRFVVANTGFDTPRTISSVALGAVSGGTATITLTLAAAPGDWQALDVWWDYANGAGDGSASLIRDNVTDADGITTGRAIVANVAAPIIAAQPDPNAEPPPVEPATLTIVDGVNKNSWVTVSGSPALTAARIGGTSGAYVGVRTRGAAIPMKYQVEFTINSYAGGLFGIDDGTRALNVSHDGSGIVNLFKGGFHRPPEIALAAVENGDIYTIQIDRTALTYALIRTRSGTTTTLRTGAIVNAPNHHTFVVFQDAGEVVVNNGQNPFTVPLPSGYLGYAG